MGRLDKLRKGRKEKDAVNIFKFKKVVNSHVTYFYKDGRTLYHLSKNKETDKIKNIDFYLPHYNKSVMRAYTDDNENIHKIRYFQPGTDIIQAEVFVDSEFHPYVVKEYTYTENEKKLDRIILTKKDGHVTVFKKENNFFRHWFTEIFSDGDIVINDARLLDKPLLETKRNIKKIFQIHESHLENPSNFLPLFESVLSNSDTIVTLTDAQKQDILINYPHLTEHINVIPHSIKLTPLQYKRTSNQICIVSRLDPLKNISDAIEAFMQFNEIVPGFVLTIYGVGKAEEALLQLIKENKLDHIVQLKGFIKNPNPVFQESKFSIMCSSHEAFALSVLESIANGCPVISYDTMWGPSDILDDSSGRITKEKTPKALCEAMVEEIQHPKDRNKVRDRARIFSQDAFYEAWADIMFNSNKKNPQST